VFYGRADPNTAGHTGFLTMDEARQMAVDFARLRNCSIAAVQSDNDRCFGKVSELQHPVIFILVAIFGPRTA
jgi:hypothetical protein